jgi:pimeloyl-ACP methyl ester carboxylesterase
LPKIKVNGVDLYYEVQGKGFPLVMIMGLSANLDWWAPEPITTLVRHFKVLTFDNRGAGRSEDPGVAFTIKTLADDTVGLMNAVKIPKAHVLGISMGGMIAQELVLNYPDKVEKLVLCSTNAGGGKQVPPSEQVLAKLTADTSLMSPEDQVRMVVSLMFTEDFIKQHPKDIATFVQQLTKVPIKPASYKRQLQAILQFNAGRRLKTVTKPTLVVHGKKDILIPPENGNIIAGLIPGAKIALFDESGHAVFSPEPAKVNQAIIDFLK